MKAMNLELHMTWWHYCLILAMIDRREKNVIDPKLRSASIWVCLPGSSDSHIGDCYIMGHPDNRVLERMGRHKMSFFEVSRA